MWLLLFGALVFPLCSADSVLEQKLFKNYERKHRPVKSENTAVQVSVFMTISHIESVNEHEQTMSLHGHLVTKWKDEYLQWNPQDYNGTERIEVSPWKIWQPALSVYNSARGNSWHLYFHGLPASLSKDGSVVATGSFSFQVTCLFDFKNWPYDEQRCPIVISDWVYDLSRVSLSENFYTGNDKPAVKLNYDPLDPDPKTHVAGWEVTDTWKKHCYWSNSGCQDEAPSPGQPIDFYWSLIEFGIVIRRHAPYFAVTVIIPTLISSLLTLCSFWIDSPTYPTSFLLFNILLQGLYGWDLIRQLPPGSGTVPRIVSLYGFNLAMTSLAFGIHVLIQYLLTVLPADLDLPLKASEWASKLRSIRLFNVEGMSFDPQDILVPAPPSAEHSGETSPSPESGTSGEELVELQVEAEEEKTQETRKGTELTLSLIRRVVFCVYAIMYMIALPICLF